MALIIIVIIAWLLSLCCVASPGSHCLTLDLVWKCVTDSQQWPLPVSPVVLSPCKYLRITWETTLLHYTLTNHQKLSLHKQPAARINDRVLRAVVMLQLVFYRALMRLNARKMIMLHWASYDSGISCNFVTSLRHSVTTLLWHHLCLLVTCDRGDWRLL